MPSGLFSLPVKRDSPRRVAAAGRGIFCRAARALHVTVAVFLLGLIPAAHADFSHGVAAAEPASGVGMFWTRADFAGGVKLLVTEDAELLRPVAEVAGVAEESNDLTVKLEVGGLQPGREYFYQFRRTEDETQRSEIGRLRTAPSAGARSAMRYVFTGDSNFAFAPMIAMGYIPAEQPDVFIWFGDTIYADVAAGGLGGAVSREDYRAKYRQMFSDAGVRAALAGSTLLVGWDDHEVSNDYAGNDPALDRDQQRAAYEAFFEYMPVRPQGIASTPFRIYQSYHHGAHVDLFLLDARQYRDPSAERDCRGNLDPLGALTGPLLRDPSCIDALDSDRTMLGRTQLDWLKQSLAESTATWKFIINNVPMSFIGVFPYDRWDGYDRERRELLEFIDSRRITGVVVLTTDIHANAFNPNVMRYFRLHRPDYRLRNGVVVPEIIVGPIGNATARQSIAGVGGSILGASRSEWASVAVDGNAAASGGRTTLLDSLTRYFSETLTRINRLDFIELNRLSYVVIDVGEDGGMRLAWRGIAPEAAVGGTAAPHTFFSTYLAPPDQGSHTAPGFLGGVPCVVPVLVVFALPIAVSVRARRGFGKRAVRQPDRNSPQA